jgi:hypothetical protein
LAGLDGKAILAKYDQVVKQENSLMRLEFERLATDTLSKNDIVSLELFNQKQVEYMSAEEREARTDMLAGKRMADAAIGMKGIANQALRWDEAGQEITNYLEALPDTVTDVQRSVNAAGASQILGLE